jgi:hypothetical protein
VTDWEIGSARGARGVKAPKPHPPFYVLRSMTVEDLPLLRSPPALLPDQVRVQSLGEVRYTHHMLAQLLVQGKSQSECSALTGYSPSYISLIKDDPAFRELLCHYEGIREASFVDTIARMRGLGLHTLEELQSRLASEPARWTKRELMELAELCLIKPMAATRGAVAPIGGGPGVSVSVNFVSPSEPALPNPSSKVIDHEPEPIG